ncbi:SlyX family protein [Stutzerimonas azotifigens]|uniref:SlyX family protein n=1 Tax=Stutzerimonas azotifigens TaxID=291995 RepID=UPI000422B3A9|nr:SlyX family protein [Stutzerimonas azotifigens]
MNELESRIAELEVRLAFQDDTIQALNDEVVRLQGLIERLGAQLTVLARRQEELSGRIEEGDEAPPPHY